MNKILLIVLTVGLSQTPVVAQIRDSRGASNLIRGRNRIIHNRTNWSLNVPGRISNPNTLGRVTLYPTIRGDYEQLWIGGSRYGSNTQRYGLTTGAGSRLGQSCLNSINAVPGENLTTYLCDNNDAYQRFTGVRVLGIDLQDYPNNQYLIRLGTGNINSSLCVEPALSNEAFVPNANLTYQKCNPSNRNQWFEFQPWN